MEKIKIKKYNKNTTIKKKTTFETVNKIFKKYLFFIKNLKSNISLSYCGLLYQEQVLITGIYSLATIWGRILCGLRKSILDLIFLDTSLTPAPVSSHLFPASECATLYLALIVRMLNTSMFTSHPFRPGPPSFTAAFNLC